MVINIHRIDRKNVGDMAASPLDYFQFPKAKKVEIMSINKPDILQNHIIIGGGGLLARSFFEKQMDYITANAKGKVISWGIGHNCYEGLGEKLSYPSYMDRFHLHGIRDYEEGYNYVPCVSCMSPLFDKKYTVKHGIVVYEHPRRRIAIDEKFPRMDNTVSSFKRVIEFLASAEIILTSTFHGAYWGLLLGKRVLAFPWSTKFYTLRYKPVLCDEKDWKDYLGGNVNKQLTSYPEALEDCRELNRRHYEKVCHLISD
jgi:hypothetical protein